GGGGVTGGGGWLEAAPDIVYREREKGVAVCSPCGETKLGVGRNGPSLYKVQEGKPNIHYFYVFGSLCYPTNDHDDLGKIKPKANIELGINCMKFQDSSEDSKSVPSKTDLDNLFGPVYEGYYAKSLPKVSDNSTSNTPNNEKTSSSSSIVIEEDEAP
nr:hypothetical protein [Tanacetum cinerariifolium]